MRWTADSAAALTSITVLSPADWAADIDPVIFERSGVDLGLNAGAAWMVSEVPSGVGSVEVGDIVASELYEWLEADAFARVSMPILEAQAGAIAIIPRHRKPMCAEKPAQSLALSSPRRNATS
jgi:hypothetical protein